MTAAKLSLKLSLLSNPNSNVRRKPTVLESCPYLQLARCVSRASLFLEVLMGCNPIYNDGQMIGIACGRGQTQRCQWCGSKSTKLCDYPITKPVFGQPDSKSTCDKPICARCAVSIGPNRDYCPPHARFAAKQVESPIGDSQ